MVTSTRVDQRFVLARARWAVGVFAGRTGLAAAGWLVGLSAMGITFFRRGILSARIRLPLARKKTSPYEFGSYRPRRFALPLSGAANICLFHPDCNRWPRIFTGSAWKPHGLRRVAGLPEALGCAAVLTASEDFHLALKQNSRDAL